MTSNEMLEKLKKLADIEKVEKNGYRQITCDTIKSGDPDREIKKVAVAMFATVDTIRKAKEASADLLIVHEPTFYEHTDDPNLSIIAKMKKQLIDDSGLTIFRFHDYAHAMEPDLIYEGEMALLGLKGQMIKREDFAITRFMLDEPMTALELAKRIEDKLGINHVRISGCNDKPGRLISCSFGTPGKSGHELEECDFVLTGEICEWAVGEMARDWAAFGYNKAILVLTHLCSERGGMMLLAQRISAMFPELDICYIESGELFSYTD